jgi:hypothetical protein
MRGHHTVVKIGQIPSILRASREVIWTLSASRYMDLGDGGGILSSERLAISALRDFRFAADPNGANSMVSV